MADQLANLEAGVHLPNDIEWMIDCIIHLQSQRMNKVEAVHLDWS
jgi:hypothetical protein